jgi:hypothetical protein
MGYGQVSGRRPFEAASKVVHSEIIKNPAVQEFVGGCEFPTAPPTGLIRDAVVKVPKSESKVTAVIAIDGGYTETALRERYPSARVAFLTFGPLFFNLKDLDEMDATPFLGPEDMARLKNLERYNLVLPTKLVRPRNAPTFSDGARAAIHAFFKKKDAHLLSALRWLLFRGWRADAVHYAAPWKIPACPAGCGGGGLDFTASGPDEQKCPNCGSAVYLTDALRCYERIDDEFGATAILGFLLTAAEQLVLVHLIKSIWQMKPALLREVLFVKDGPLAFFGTAAPLHQPMRELMQFLGAQGSAPLINLVGIEKSGPFVEHALQIEEFLGRGEALVLTNEYIYNHVVPGDPRVQKYGGNTYYGGKLIYKGDANDTYVLTVPTGDWDASPKLADFYNAPEALGVLSRLRCSMYDNALLPVALANRLVSLADAPSAEILAKFARDRIGH